MNILVKPWFSPVLTLTSFVCATWAIIHQNKSELKVNAQAIQQNKEAIQENKEAIKEAMKQNKEAIQENKEAILSNRKELKNDIAKILDMFIPIAVAVNTRNEMYDNMNGRVSKLERKV